MDDLNARLAEILNDKESMEKVRAMAESLMSGDEESETDGELPDDTAQKIMQAVSLFKGGGNDNRTALLLALKPHLSDDRQKKVDTAVKLLKFIEILPKLKESGLLDF